MNVAGCDLLLFGHTHLPYNKPTGRTLVVHAGPVGKLNGGDPRVGAVLVWLGSRLVVEIRRVACAMATAGGAIRAAQLPADFPGRWRPAA